MKDFKRKMEIVNRLRPIDDNFFEKLAEDKEVCQEMLRTILGKPNLKVLQVVRQNDLPHRSYRFGNRRNSGQWA